MQMATCRWRAVWGLAVVIAALLAHVGPAAAFTQPLFGAVDAYAFGGDALGPGRLTSDGDSGTGPVSATSGSPWWCDTPGCSIAIGPGAGLGWTTVSANAADGLVSLRTGAANFSNSVAQWQVCPPWLPGCITQTPSYWGEAQTETYLRSTWRIVATDPALAQGDPVDISATLQLQGELVVGDKTRIQGGLLFNTATMANDNWLGGNERISMHTFLEVVALVPGVGYTYFEALDPGPIDHSDVLTRRFAVGDVVVLETLLSSFAGAPNDGNPKSVWVEFDQTARSSLATITPGVLLVPVPEPSSWALLLGGLVMTGLALRRRERAAADRRRSRG